MSRKLTHEEYVDRVNKVNPNVEVLGEYIGSQTKILHKCKIDGHEWYVNPNNILNGAGCPMCCHNKNKKTHKDYIEEVAKINADIEVVGEYVGAKTKILHRCKIDNYEWLATPSNILQGAGCPKCGKPQKTHEEYVSKITKINPNIEVIELYQGNAIKILHKCKLDGCEWYAVPNNILHGKGCPVCGIISQQQKRRKPHEEYVREVNGINPDVEVIGQYVNNFTKILHRCKIDGYEWITTPHSILSGNRCPRCINKERYTQEEYSEKVKELHRNIEVVERYVNSHTKILHRCKIDGCEWHASPNNILNGTGCPLCNSSKGEKLVANWLEDKNIVYIPQMVFEDCKNINQLPFDFYLPDCNIAIEYQGKQHYEPIEYFGGQKTFENQTLRDNIKREYCKKNNIYLFEIPYYSNLDNELIRLYELIKIIEIYKERR